MFRFKSRLWCLPTSQNILNDVLPQIKELIESRSFKQVRALLNTVSCPKNTFHSKQSISLGLNNLNLVRGAFGTTVGHALLTDAITNIRILDGPTFVQLMTVLDAMDSSSSSFPSIAELIEENLQPEMIDEMDASTVTLLSSTMIAHFESVPTKFKHPMEQAFLRLDLKNEANQIASCLQMLIQLGCRFGSFVTKHEETILNDLNAVNPFRFSLMKALHANPDQCSAEFAKKAYQHFVAHPSVLKKVHGPHDRYYIKIFSWMEKYETEEKTLIGHVEAWSEFVFLSDSGNASASVTSFTSALLGYPWKSQTVWTASQQLIWSKLQQYVLNSKQVWLFRHIQPLTSIQVEWFLDQVGKFDGGDIQPYQAILALKQAHQSGLWHHPTVKALLLNLQTASIASLREYSVLELMHVISEHSPMKLPSFLFKAVRNVYNSVQTPDGAKHVAPLLPAVVTLCSRNHRLFGKEMIKEMGNVMLFHTTTVSIQNVAEAMLDAALLVKEVEAENPRKGAPWPDPDLFNTFITRFENSADVAEKDCIAILKLLEIIHVVGTVVTRVGTRCLRLGNPKVCCYIMKTFLLVGRSPLDPILQQATRVVEDHVEEFESEDIIMVSQCIRGLSNFQPLMQRCFDHLTAKLTDTTSAYVLQSVLQLFEGTTIEDAAITTVAQLVARRIVLNISSPNEVIETLQRSVAVTNSSLDKTLAGMIKWLSLQVPRMNFKDVHHTILMMESGWKHETLLRSALDRFFTVVTSENPSGYQIVSAFSALRKADAKEMFSEIEIQQLSQKFITLICEHHKHKPLSGRLMASVLTTCSTFHCEIKTLLDSFQAQLLSEISSMDAITVSAVLLSLARLRHNENRTLIETLFMQCEAIDWARFPTQAIHLLYAGAYLECQDIDVFVYICHDDSVAKAVRTVLDNSAMYRMMSEAVTRLLADGCEWVSCSPLTRLVVFTEN